MYAAKMYWGEFEAVQKADIGVPGTNVSELAAYPTADDAIGVAVDGATSRLDWSNAFGSTIYESAGTTTEGGCGARGRTHF